MKQGMQPLVWAAVAAVALVAAGPAGSEVVLQWDSDWLQVQPNSPASLAVVLNDTLDLRTVELRVQYDPNLVTGVDTRPGALFDGVPCFIWEDYEEPTAGSWHGYAVIIGGVCSITGPGELFVWEFTARQNTGVAPVVTVEVTLFAPDATRIPDVSLDRTFISVGAQPASSPPSSPQLGLQVYPNPFNPRVQIRVLGGNCPEARLEVFDLQGRRQASVYRGALPPEGLVVAWDGRDDRGSPLPSGSYLFRCWGPGCAATTARGLLLR